MTTDDALDPATAFGALGNELRVEILRTLADRHRAEPEDPAVGFAELRKAVDVRDSGRFRYHLEELRDAFVEKTDDGYQLTYAGTQVVAAIVAGTYTGQTTVGPTELDSECSVCGAPAIGSYDDGMLVVACENEHPLFAWAVPPNAAADETIPQLVELATLLVQRAFDLVRAGFCPQCYSAVEARVERIGSDASGAIDGSDAPGAAGGSDPSETVDDGSPARAAGPSVRFRSTCDACGGRLDGPVGFCLLSDPDVAALYRATDRPLRERYPWELGFARDDAVEAVGGEGAVQIDVALDGRTLSVTVDERGRVVETDGPE